MEARRAQRRGAGVIDAAEPLVVLALDRGHHAPPQRAAVACVQRMDSRTHLSEALDSGVCTLTLVRPEKRNALSLELRTEVADTLRRLAADESVFATVVTGAGSAFCAGFDFTQFGGDAANKRAIVETTEAFFAAVIEHPKPLIAAVNGPAMGGGFALALLSDLRLAHHGASFGFPQVRHGIPPSYAAARAVLPRAVAVELCLTGRVMNAEEALSVGLISELVPAAALVERARALAGELAPPAVAAEVKRLARLDRDRAWLALLEEEKRALRDALLA